MDWHLSLGPVAWSLLHLGAVAAACLTRLSVGLGLERALQAFAGAGFLLVALAAIGTSAAGGDHLRLWILSGTTLGLMVVAVVVEPRHEPIDPLLRRFATRAP